ncbi:flagellar protein FlhE [Alloalcanivorax sp. C16-1]|uniref:flagellar protein FlhE n=1 Tax=Alloalcanivorax sp. C16-1 TaxID=3390051 RepID=UPI0039707861
MSAGRAGRGRWLLPPLLLGLAAAAGAATVSWTASPAAVRVAGPDRDYHSVALTPPAAGFAPARFSWAYRVTGGPPPRAWLCQADHCVRLPGARGRAPAPPRWRADAPLRFRFRLVDGAAPVRVERLRLTVTGPVAGQSGE